MDVNGLTIVELLFEEIRNVTGKFWSYDMIFGRAYGYQMLIGGLHL